MSYPDNDPKAAWLWGYLLHSDTIFTNRTNFFLVAESMVMVSYATVVSAAPARTLIALVIAILGLVFTVIWWYVNGRTVINIGNLIDKIDEIIPDYKEIRVVRPGISAHKTLAYILPPFTLGVWILLVILLWN